MRAMGRARHPAAKKKPKRGRRARLRAGLRRPFAGRLLRPHACGVPRRVLFMDRAARCRHPRCVGEDAPAGRHHHTAAREEEAHARAAAAPAVGQETARRPARIEGAGHGKAQEADGEEGLTSAELVRQCLRYGKCRRDKAA